VAKASEASGYHPSLLRPAPRHAGRPNGDHFVKGDPDRGRAPSTISPIAVGTPGAIAGPRSGVFVSRDRGGTRPGELWWREGRACARGKRPFSANVIDYAKNPSRGLRGKPTRGRATLRRNDQGYASVYPK